MAKKTFTIIMVIIIAVASLAAVYNDYQRHSVEQANKAIEMAVVYDEALGLANTTGQSTGQILDQLKQAGITAVLFKEPTVNDLEDQGLVVVYNRQQFLLSDLYRALPDNLKGEISRSGYNTYLLTTNQGIYAQVLEQLSIKVQGVKGFQSGDKGIIALTQLKPQLKEIGLGFTKEGLELVASKGLRVIPQLRTWPEASQDDIEQVFQSLNTLPNLTAVAFNDKTLPGFPKAAGTLAKEIDLLDVPLVQIEFYNQKGLTTLALLLDKQVVRLHSIETEKINEMLPSEAIDRYLLAATDRNQRILLVKLYTSSETVGIMEKNLGYITTLHKKLAREGFTFSAAQPFQPLQVSRISLFLIGLGVIAGGLLLLSLFGLTPVPGLVLGGLGALAWLGLLFAGPLSLGLKGMALASTIIFPSLAVMHNLKKDGSTVGGSILLLIRTTLFSLIGALLMVGLLASVSFMIKLDQFAGIKLASVMPLLIILGYFAWKIGNNGGLLRQIKALLDQPILVKYVLVAGFLLVAAVIFILRTGNETAAVSDLELRFRALLEQVLVVRPRTKEFLIGHPLMMLLFYTGLKDARYLPLLFLGAIGQISLVNTFAHIHTPLVISLWRTANGLILGILIGVLVIYLYRLLLVWGKRLLNE